MKKEIMTMTLVFGAIAVKAQIPQPDPDTTAKHFLTVASITDLQEVNAGQLATQMAKMPEVRQFGQMMVKDHGSTQQELLQVAKTSGIDLPSAATKDIRPDLMLKNAGDKFDKLYVHAMVTGHRNAVETFQNYAVTGKDPRVKAFAQRTLPTLKQHLTEILALEKKLK